MKLGRCVSESTKLGCSADVLEIVSRKCSGKRECEIRVPDSDLGELKPCGEMWTYLEASYTCMKVVEDDRSCTVSATSSEPVHITAQSSTRCGSSRQPWQIEAPAGQRITVSVVDFARASTARDGPPPADRRCRGRVYGFVVDKTQKTNVSVCETPSAGALSGETQVNAQSSSSDGRAVLTTSSNSAELLIVRDDHLANNFLVRVEATGCANIIPAEDAYLKRVDDHNIVVGCYETRQTWQLSCQGNKWTGTVGVCDSRSEQRHHGNTFSGEKSASTTGSQDDSEIFQIVAITAVTSVGLAVCLTIICIGIYCLRRYPKKGETDGRKAPYQNILMNDAGNLSTKAGQPWPVSATSTNQFTPSGQYFVLDPEHTEA